MNSRLNRARAFLLGCSKSTALRVLPLALLAIGSMQGVTMVDTVTISNPNVTVGDGSIFAMTLLTGNVVKFFGSGNAACQSTTSTCVLEFDFQVLNNQGPNVQLDYQLFVESFSGDISLDISNGLATIYHSSLIPEDMGPVADLGSFEVANGLVRFRFESSFFGEGFFVDIPGNSIDFSPGAATNNTVPEPSTMALTLAGATALALARRRRK